MTASTATETAWEKSWETSWQRLRPQDSQLLLIDVQEKLLPAMAGGEGWLACIVRLLKAMRLFEVPVLVSEQYPQGLGKTASLLRESLPKGARFGEKRCFSVADDEGLLEELNNAARETVVIVGIETHVCVWQTARDLRRRGFRVLVVEDATTSRSLEDRRCALESLRFAGIEVVRSEMLLFDWQQTSQGGAFKEVSQLVR